MSDFFQLSMTMHVSQIVSKTARPMVFPLGEFPPPAPRTCFGRDELIEELIGLAENLEPIAVIGTGGIGKTSIALTLLHHSRMKQRFGDNRRFIRCDQFPASRAHFLARLSKVIGTGVDNPEDLTLLRPFLSSHEMFIVLDNAESILDPQGQDAQEIYSIVEELCRFETVCLCITSRLTTVPRHCKSPQIPTLSVEAARSIFYSIHGDGERSGIVDDLLQRLDFHALSITLLATIAFHNKWDYDELSREWETHRAQVLRTDYNESLAATIELSLASPTFCKLGPDARELLGVIAFFPQGVDEGNLDSFFPTVTDRKNIFTKFRVLSLTHRSNGFVTMLAPIREYLCLQDPKSSPLLCKVKDCYFARLSVDLYPSGPTFEEAKWIRSEDVNVEHLLNVFTSISIGTTNYDIWNACAHFMRHLYWHRRRLTILGPKIHNLPDDHPSKPECLFELSSLFHSVGNYAEQKRLLHHVLRLEMKWGNDGRVAATLGWLSDTNRLLLLHEEGIRQAKEALQIYDGLGDTAGRARCLIHLAYLLHSDEQIDAAEEAVSHAIQLLPEKGQEFWVCRSHHILGRIYHSKDKKENAIQHFKAALGIASTFNWHISLFWVHYTLARLFVEEDGLGSAQAHVKQAKSYAIQDTYLRAVAMILQARIWFRQGKSEEARSELLGALEIFEMLGAQICRCNLHSIEEAMKSRPTKGEPDSSTAFSRFLRLHITPPT